MAIYLFLLFLIPYQTHSVFSTNILGLTIIKWVGICTLITAFISQLSSDEKIKLYDSPQAKLFGLYCLIPLVLWFGEGGLKTGHAQQSFISFFIFFYVTLKLVTSRKKINQVVWALAISMFFGSLYVIREYLALKGAIGSHFRSFGATFGDPNYYALSAILVLPFIYYLFKHSKSFLTKLGLTTMSLVYFSALMVTQSRGAFVGLAMMLLTTFFISKKKIKSLAVILLIILIGIAAAPDSLRERFAGTRIAQHDKTVTGDEASTTRRWHLFLAGIEMTKDKPLTGVGLGRFKENSIIYYPSLGNPGIAHSTYLEIMAELGIPELLLFLAIIAYTFRDLFRLRKRKNIDDKDLFFINTMIVALTGFLFSCTFLSGQYTKIFWVLVFITIKLKKIYLEPDQR